MCPCLLCEIRCSRPSAAARSFLRRRAQGVLSAIGLAFLLEVHFLSYSLPERGLRKPDASALPSFLLSALQIFAYLANRFCRVIADPRIRRAAEQSLCDNSVRSAHGLSRHFAFRLQRAVLTTQVTAALRQRILFVDWTDKTEKIARAALRDRWNAYQLVGCAPNSRNRFTCQPPASIPAVGRYEEVRTLCEKGLIDIVILGDGRRSEEDVMALARECEKAMVDFVVIPSGFHILLSGLELTTISGVPVLGVTKLPLNNPVNWMLKRVIDVVGAW